MSPCLDDVGGDWGSMWKSSSSLFRPFERNNASRHALFGPVRHNSPRREDLKTLAIHLEITCRVSADLFRIPGNVDLGNPLVSNAALYNLREAVPIKDNQVI